MVVTNGGRKGHGYVPETHHRRRTPRHDRGVRAAETLQSPLQSCGLRGDCLRLQNLLEGYGGSWVRILSLLTVALVVPVIPIPTALPLFLSALGVMGFMG